jgi:catechol 2,3-dioxygenase-like lactoylglutathione lyase family enzyme
MADFPVTRIGTILAVASVPASVEFYTRHLGFTVDALFEDPGYAILVRDGVRLSLAEQGHPAPDRPGISLHAPTDRTDLQVNLVLETPDAWAVHRALAAEGVASVAPPFEPPWGGCRFFVSDPDGYLVELEQMA